MTLAGGETQYESMVSWGSKNLTPDEVARFNAAINSNDMDKVAPVLEALKARFEAQEGTFKRTSIESADSVHGANVVGYVSSQEIQRDMQNPLYKAGDPTFHALVKERFKNSKKF